MEESELLGFDDSPEGLLKISISMEGWKHLRGHEMSVLKGVNQTTWTNKRKGGVFGKTICYQQRTGSIPIHTSTPLPLEFHLEE